MKWALILVIFISHQYAYAMMAAFQMARHDQRKCATALGGSEPTLSEEGARALIRSTFRFKGFKLNETQVEGVGGTLLLYVGGETVRNVTILQGEVHGLSNVFPNESFLTILQLVRKLQSVSHQAEVKNEALVNMQEFGAGITDQTFAEGNSALERFDLFVLLLQLKVFTKESNAQLVQFVQAASFKMGLKVPITRAIESILNTIDVYRFNRVFKDKHLVKFANQEQQERQQRMDLYLAIRIYSQTHSIPFVTLLKSVSDTYGRASQPIPVEALIQLYTVEKVDGGAAAEEADQAEASEDNEVLPAITQH